MNLRPRTYQGYRMYVERHLIPNLGQIELGKLLPMHLQSFYSKGGKTRTSSGGSCTCGRRLRRSRARSCSKSRKSQNSRRTVALAPGTVALLQAHKRRQAENRLRLGAEYHDHGLVFCRETENPSIPLP